MTDMFLKEGNYVVRSWRQRQQNFLLSSLKQTEENSLFDFTLGLTRWDLINFHQNQITQRGINLFKLVRLKPQPTEEKSLTTRLHFIIKETMPRNLCQVRQASLALFLGTKPPSINPQTQHDLFYSHSQYSKVRGIRNQCFMFIGQRLQALLWTLDEQSGRESISSSPPSFISFPSTPTRECKYSKDTLKYSMKFGKVGALARLAENINELMAQVWK